MLIKTPVRYYEAVATCTIEMSDGTTIELLLSDVARMEWESEQDRLAEPVTVIPAHGAIEMTGHEMYIVAEANRRETERQQRRYREKRIEDVAAIITAILSSTTDAPRALAEWIVDREENET